MSSTSPGPAPQLTALLGPHRWRRERLRALQSLDPRWRAEDSTPASPDRSEGFGCTLAMRAGRGGGLVRQGAHILAWRGELRRAPIAGLAELTAADGPAADEVLVALLRDHGVRTCELLDGPVTLLSWDARRGQLVACRDRFGLVPLLYLTPHPRRPLHLALTTDGGAVEALLEGALRPRRARLRAFLMGLDGGPRGDFVEGVERLRAAERLVASGEGHRIETFWSPVPSFTPAEADGGDVLRARRVVDEVVTSRLGLAAPAICMSGGLDSPALAATVVRQRGHDQSRPLPAISQIAPGIPSTDESPQLDLLQRELPLDLRRFRIDREPVLGSPAGFCDHLVLGPQIHPGEVYQRRFSIWAREQFPSAQPLRGLGADEVLDASGSQVLSWFLSHRDWRGLTGLASEVGARPVARRVVRRGLEELGVRPLMREGMALMRRALGRPVPQPPPWSRPESWVPGGAAVPEDEPLDWDRDEAHRGAVWIGNAQGWAWEMFARGGVREDLAASVVTGFPYLDRRLWECFWRIPPPRLHEPGLDRPVLRRAMADRLPAAIIERPKETFFDAVIVQGLVDRNARVVHRLFASSRLADLGLIEPAAFLDAFARYCRAGAGSWRGARPVSHTLRIWPTIAAELWVRALLEGPQAVAEGWGG